MNWIIGLFPLVVKLIEVIESLTTKGGEGANKKKVVMSVIEVFLGALRVMGIISEALEVSLKGDLAAMIDAIVSLYNGAGVFKHGG